LKLRDWLNSKLKLSAISCDKNGAYNHWYRWLIANGGNKDHKQQKQAVSNFLHDIHYKKSELLRKRRLEQYVTQQSLILNGTDINALNKAQLIQFLCKHKFHEEMYPDEIATTVMGKATTTKASIISKFKENQLPKLQEEYKIDHDIDKLLLENEEIQACWAYKYGLLRLWLEKVYLCFANMKLSSQQFNNDPIVKLSKGNLPYWSLQTSRLQKEKSTNWKHELNTIMKLWNVFKQEEQLKRTYSTLRFADDSRLDSRARKRLNWRKRQIFTLYMRNPIKYHLFYDKDEYPQSLHYITEHYRCLQPKEWHDINFSLWKSEISRIQIGCSCKSGEQLPSFCAHCGTVLWLLYYALNPNENLDQLLKPHRKDKLIRRKIINLLPHDNYGKTISQLYQNVNGTSGKICICDNAELLEPTIRCTGCQNLFHPSCCNLKWPDLLEKGTQLESIWQCPQCMEKLSFCVMNSKWKNHPTKFVDE